MMKERITAVDNKNRSITYTVFEGNFTNGYKSFATTVTVSPNGDGSLVKWSVDYEKENAHIPTPTAFVRLLELTSKELDVQFLKQA
ncbi:Bet v I domain [Macleaya cordata]|uniref:Bet v I domain n=1 Tax=Macleaya cordata TaxID=56857 RepID=A0A200Q809_MACCD|nr:Bet v I domain [Macleaya cordata]